MGRILKDEDKNTDTAKSHNDSTETPPGKIFLIEKPIDYTSFDIVRIFKKEFNLKKAGHAGTLDPKATGLLILCSNKMTKLINEFVDYDKEYEGVIRIGATTKSFDTESAEENIIENFDFSDEKTEKVRKSFLGESFQTPPMYSAVKFGGKPLYKFARKGRVVERKERKIFISEFETKKISRTELFFRISCSKGTYIRSIANDFGEKLGAGGYLKELKRTRIGKFLLEDFTESVRGIRYKMI